MAAKRAFPSTLVRLELPQALSQAREEYRASWLLRRIAAASKEGAASVFVVEEALFSKGSRLEGLAERFWGQAYYSLRGPDCERMEAAASAAGFEPARELPACELVEATLDFPAAMAAEAEAALKAWLAEERVDFIETKEAGEGAAPSRRLKASARDTRKAILIEARLSHPPAVEGEEARFAVDLSLGHKARLADLLSRLSPAGRRSASLRLLSY